MAGSQPPKGSEEHHQGLMLTPATAAVGDHWEVQYSRFFNCPRSSSSTGAGGHHPSLTRLLRQSRGSWISSFSSLAYLKLLTTTADHSDTSRSIILTVTLVNNIVEEHYISKLHFTWPQVSCFSGYPPRGSRIVFMSYKDPVGMIQKFAVRFLTIYEAERFINSLKELFGHEKIDGSSTSGISKSKTSSQSEIVLSIQPVNRSTQDCDPISLSADYSQPMYRPTQDWDPTSSSADNSQPLYRPTQDWSPIASSADACTQQMQPSDQSQNSNPLEATTLSQDVQKKLSALPPSFTSLLMNCCPATQQATRPTIPEEVNLKKEITKYLEDSSFQDMLSKVQKVINEFGDDLLL